jgi:outer membrane protein OmpA-like peptidoglycan-associated protein
VRYLTGDRKIASLSDWRCIPMLKSFASPAKVSKNVARRQKNIERLLIIIWVFLGMTIGGCATAATNTDLMADEPDGLAAQNGQNIKIDHEQDELNAIRAAPTTRGLLVILPELLFRSRESRLSPSTLRALEPLARFLMKHPDRLVEVDGFSDGLGNIQDNLVLSKNRAEAVKSHLVTLGATAAQISAYGFGSQAPVASDSHPVERRRNRRIEIIIGRKDAAIEGWSDS